MLQAAAIGQPNADQSNLTIQSFINQHPFSKFQGMIFAICFAVVVLDGFDTAAIGFLAPFLQSEWHIAKQSLAPVLSAALLGLSIGSLAAGPVADKSGRKIIIGISVLLFGLACTASAFAASLEQLVVLRFITGLGLGAALPNAVTLMSEFCPDQRRSTLTNALFCGFPLGAAMGGFVTAWMIPLWGWRSVLLAGGVVPLILTVPVVLFLPESVRFMAAAGKSRHAICAVLGKISSKSINALQIALPGKKPAATKNGLALILSRRYLIGTTMLWVTYFMGLVIFYSLINWLPILLKDTGIDPKTASLIAALFPLGGVGAIFFGWLMDRFNANLVIALGYATTAVLLYAIGQSTGSNLFLIVFVFAGGVIMNTSQVSLASLAASFYPTQARVTGVSWMLGVGRFGGVAGSYFVAELVRRNVEFTGIIGFLSVAGLIAATALLIKHFSRPGEL